MVRFQNRIEMAQIRSHYCSSAETAGMAARDLETADMAQHGFDSADLVHNDRDSAGMTHYDLESAVNIGRSCSRVD